MRLALLLILLATLISCDPAPPAHAVTKDAGAVPNVHGAWNIESPLTEIPSGELSGTLFGNDFVLEEATINAHAITLRGKYEADSFSAPDVTIFVGTDDLADQQVVTPLDDDMVPHVHARFPVPGRNRPGLMMYTEMYSMRLIVDERTDETVTARVHLSLPDYQHSHLVGRFVARVN